MLSNDDADAINDQMAEQMERRRQVQPERRQAAARRAVERRKTCSFCFQPGDHRTAAECLRALERG